MFGKRKNTFSRDSNQSGLVSDTHAKLDVDGEKRVFPRTAWNGSDGNLLREAGLSPDCPENLVMTQELANARLEETQTAQSHFVEQVNALLQSTEPTATVAPWAKIPWSVWSGEVSEFLIVVCGLFPTEPWNTFLMPADAESARVLGMPLHPRGPIEGVEEHCNKLLLKLRDQHKSEFQAIFDRKEQDKGGSIQGFADLTEQTKRKVPILAQIMVKGVFGQQVFDRHMSLFGELFGQDKA